MAMLRRCLGDAAPHTLGAPESPAGWPAGLPSWWPFYSDCLKDRVRDAVKASRRLAGLTQWFIRAEDLACVVIGPFVSPAEAQAHAEWLDSLPCGAMNLVVGAAEAERLMATGHAWLEVTPEQDRATAATWAGSRQPACPECGVDGHTAGCGTCDADCAGPSAVLQSAPSRR